MSPNLRFSSHLYRAFSHSPLLKVLVILAALVGVQFGQYLALPSSQRCELQHSYKSDRNKPSSLSSNYTLPPGFTFTPPTTSRPLSKYAIITLLTGPASDIQDPNSPILTDDCLLALFQTYTFLHNPLTSLKPTDDAEFIVMMTPGQPRNCQNALKVMGARLLEVPLITSPEDLSHRYHYTYTKYQMWALEGVFERVLYVDGDLLFLTESPVQLFHRVDVFHRAQALSRRFSQDNGTTNTLRKFYGGCLDWQKKQTINGGLLLLEPSLKDYHALIELIPGTRGFGDQKTLEVYYNRTGPRPPVVLPRRFNTQWLSQRKPFELVDAVGVHWKPFGEPAGKSEEARNVIHWFSQSVLEIRRIQMEFLERGVAVPVFPVSPIPREDLAKFRKMRTRYDRIAVWAPAGTGAQDGQLLRRAYCERFQQAVCVDREVSEVLDQFKVLLELLNIYEWVWMVHPELKLTGNERWPLHEALYREAERETAVMVFKDCEGELSGSIFFSKLALDALRTVHERNMEVDGTTDTDLWRQLLNEVHDKRNPRVRERQQDLYEFDDRYCHGFWNNTL